MAYIGLSHVDHRIPEPALPNIQSGSDSAIGSDTSSPLVISASDSAIGSETGATTAFLQDLDQAIGKATSLVKLSDSDQAIGEEMPIVGLSDSDQGIGVDNANIVISLTDQAIGGEPTTAILSIEDLIEYFEGNFEAEINLEGITSLEEKLNAILKAWIDLEGEL